MAQYHLTLHDNPEGETPLVIEESSLLVLLTHRNAALVYGGTAYRVAEIVEPPAPKPPYLELTLEFDDDEIDKLTRFALVHATRVDPTPIPASNKQQVKLQATSVAALIATLSYGTDLSTVEIGELIGFVQLIRS